MEDGDTAKTERKGPMTELVLVDFDDTLVETAPAFRQSREALFARLLAEGFSEKDSSRVHHDVVEPELLVLFGMGPFRLEPSFRDTYVRLCMEGGRKPDPQVADECGALGRDFMGQPKLLEGAIEALKELSKRAHTVIYSQASHPDYQVGRIRDAGVTEIVPVERIRITPKKTKEAFRMALAHFGIPSPENATMIGNSLRSDINPALEAGAQAILVEPYEMWAYDVVPPVSDNFPRFTTFPEAVDHLLGNGSP
jgi:putative hydrolase of the HAD superfamily